jgi:phage-related protein
MDRQLFRLQRGLDPDDFKPMKKRQKTSREDIALGRRRFNQIGG